MSKEQTGFRETITTSAEAHCRYIRQSSEPAMYADVWLRVEPLEQGKGFEFANLVTEDVIPLEYSKSVEEGVREAMANGVLQGYPMTDLRLTLFNGSSHPVDSWSEPFKRAGAIGFKEAASKAHPIVLEPDAS